MHQQFSFFAAINLSNKRLANKRQATKCIGSAAAVIGSALALGGCAATTGTGVMDANSTIGTANNVVLKNSSGSLVSVRCQVKF